MRNPNGYGGVVTLPGNRRCPYRARITSGWEECGNVKKQKFLTIGYYPTREEALMALAQYHCHPWNAQNRAITFQEVYEEWSPRHFEIYPSSQRVIECTMKHCRSVWNRRMRDLRTSDLQRLMDSLGGLSRAYQLKVRTLLHMQYDWCMKNDILVKDYSRYVEVSGSESQSRQRVFSGREIHRLIKLSQGGASEYEPPKYRGSGLFDTLLILLYTGVRVGELLDMRWEDVDFKKRCINLRGTKTKAARRLVPLHKNVIPILERIKAAGGEFVVSFDGEPLSYSQYKYSYFDKVMAALGMDHTPHDTRHTFVSALDTAGVPRITIKFIVGHSLTRDVTDVYTHKALPELLSAVNKIKY